MQIPSALQVLYDTPAYDGTGYIELETLTFGDRSLYLDCRADTYEPNDEPTPLPLRVSFDDVIDYSFSARQWDSFDETRDHPALVPYLYPRRELYIKSAPRDVGAAFSEAVAALRTACLGQDDPLRALGFSATSLLTRLSQGFGKLAEGPTPYVDALSAVLRRYDAAPTSLPEEPLKRWVYIAEEGAQGSEPYNGEQLRVVEFGDNWVVLEGEVVVALRENRV